MKIEYINPFIKATTEVLKVVANIEFQVGKPYLKTSTNLPKNIVIIVGITGEIRGQVVIGMDQDIAKSIASAMMMGMPVDELDELSKSALSELGNMIMGNTATILANNGTNIDITPPSLMTGENLNISMSSMTTISIPLLSSVGEIILDISLKE